jgi:hypothetical protein
MTKFETININDIHPAPYNPRIMPPSEMLKLEKGLQTFGLVDPIIIDLTDQNTIIGGHQRLEALKNINDEMELNLIRLGDIGWIFENKEIKIKYKNDQKALNLALNKINGDWDYGKLDDLLTELNDEQYLLELTGFDEVDLIPDNNMFDSDWELLDDLEDEDDAGADTYNNNVNETENTTNDEETITTETNNNMENITPENQEYIKATLIQIQEDLLTTKQIIEQELNPQENQTHNKIKTYIHDAHNKITTINDLLKGII